MQTYLRQKNPIFVIFLIPLFRQYPFSLQICFSQSWLLQGDYMGYHLGAGVGNGLWYFIWDNIRIHTDGSIDGRLGHKFIVLYCLWYMMCLFIVLIFIVIQSSIWFVIQLLICIVVHIFDLVLWCGYRFVHIFDVFFDSIIVFSWLDLVFNVAKEGATSI